MKSTTISSEFIEDLKTTDKVDKPISLENSTERIDGGYGYLIVIASFLMQACSFGIVSGFGVFLSHYRNKLFPDQPTSEIALIGTVAPTTIALASIFAGRLCDKFGIRVCALTGLGLVTLSYVTASFSTKVWQFIITQGILFGLGGALLYVPANTVVTQWFVKYRGLAVGIGTAGSGFGGFVTSVANVALFSKLSIPWVLRFNGLVVGILLLFSAIIIRPPRVTSINTNSKLSQDPFKFSMLLTYKFLLFFLVMLFGGFGYLVPLYYIPSYAEHVGLTGDQGAFLVGTINIASAFGRIILGFMGDHLGHVNMFLLCLSSSFLLLIFWLFSKSFILLMVFSVLYGLASGGFAGGFPSTCAALFGEIHLATLMGFAYAPTGLGDLFGPYIAGFILDTNHHNYSYVIYYDMGLYGLSALCLLSIVILQKRIRTNPIKSSL